MRTILVVDDEVDISEVIQTILKSKGYEVDLCFNGRDALEYLQKKSRPDLVFIDIMMPFLNGYEVLRYMRSKEGLSGIPVILMSAAPPDVQRKNLSWNEFMVKPFLVETLIEFTNKHVPQTQKTSA